VRTEVEEWIDAEEHVIAMVRAYGKGRRSGVPVDMVQAHLWTVRDGKLLRLRILATRQQALEAAGLEEQAMSEENVEVARRVLDAFNRADRDQQRLLEGFRASYLHFAEAFNRRDFEAAFAPIPPDLVFNTVVAERAEALAGELRELHGREELIAFFHDWVEEFPDWRLDVERFANPTPGVIFVTSTVHGTGRSSGVPVVRRFTEVWDMRSRPIRVSQHQDEDDALKAAGLSE
jgi:ketosteroid isomerase-like protein